MMRFLTLKQPAGLAKSSLWFAILTVCAIGSVFQAAHAVEPPVTQNQKMESGFYPYGGAEELAVKAIASAKQSIFLATDNVISGPVTQALADARKRGVNILAVLDKSQEKIRYSGAKLLIRDGIQVHIDRKHASMRNNYMIIDGETLEIGRFNYTQEAAKKNADNVLVLWHNADMAKSYRANWQEHWDHSDPYK